jgi:hypothetical protein
MAFAIIFLLVFGAVCFSYGWGFLVIIQRALKVQSVEKLSFPWVMSAGLVPITLIATVLNFWLPLSALSLGIILSGSLIIFATQWKHLIASWYFPLKQRRILFWVLVALTIIATLEHSTHIPANPDTGLYHAQTIHWIEQYSVVPGLGNLNARFAYNSSWLLVNALFSFAFLGIQSFHLLPAAFFALVLLIFLEGAAEWLQGKGNYVNILKTLLIPCMFYVSSSEISSPGTDLPVILIVWVVGVGWLERGEVSRDKRLLLDLVLFLLAIYSLTIKLSAAPLLIFAGLLLVGWIKKRQYFLVMTVLAVLILIPWLIRSIVLSGYPLFPVAGIPGFNLDWRIPLQDVVREQMGIKAWGRNPRLAAETVLQMPLIAWLKMWFYNQTTNRKIILILSGASPVFFVSLWGIFPRWQKAFKSNRLLVEALIINLLGAVFWLFTSPDFRFGYGYLIILFLLPWVILASSLKLVYKNSALFVLIVLLYLGFFMIRSFESTEFARRLLIPTDYRSLPTQPCELNNRTILCPADESWSQCWYSPFPCAPFPRPDVELRGEDFADGFRKAN